MRTLEKRNGFVLHIVTDGKFSNTAETSSTLVTWGDDSQ